MPAIPLPRLGGSPLGGPGLRLGPAGFSASPTTAGPGAVVTLSLSNPFAAWTTGPAPSLFTSPDLDLSGAVVATSTTASVTITVPDTPGGAVVITDTSTGSTVTLAIGAARVALRLGRNRRARNPA
jgi:hypothetical protein